MKKSLNKIIITVTIGSILTMPIIANAQNTSSEATETTVTSDSPTDNTTTPSEKELTKSDFKPSMYYVGGTLFTIADVDDFVNPKYFWDSRYGVTDNIKNFENVNEYNGHSSDLDNYVPEGYIFKGWKVRGYNEEYEVTEVDAILEKDQDYIDKMETSIDFSLDDSVSKSYRPVCVKYNDAVSKPVSIKVLVTSDNGIFKDEYTLTSDEKYRNAFDSDYSFREDLTGDVCAFCISAKVLPGNYTVKVEVTNDLGKVTTAEKTYAAKELTDDVNPNSVYLADTSKEYYFGDKVYLTNVTKENSWFIRNLQQDENGYYLVADANFISNYADFATMNLVLHLDMFDPATQVWTLEGNFGAVCTRDLKVHNISRDGKSVAFGELPKQEEPEVPVEPATKTPEEVVEPATETPAEEQATKTPEEPKPVEPATKTPEETKPAKPSNTSDASNVAVALVGLTLAGAVVVKTKKNA